MVNKKDYKVIGPFKGWVLQNFPFIEADFDAITSYQLWCKVVEYLNKVIYNEALLEEQSDELVDAFNNLKNYVEDYLNNLDVQEEINNKLDEMAESGELERIITEYYQGNIQVIFPEYGAEGSDTLGDCSIIKNGEYSLMIDTFTGTNVEPACYQKIREALYNANINTLSYLVITHYHGDHIGNVLNLLNDGYLAGCIVYLPRIAESYPEYNGNDIKTALTNANVTWIEIDNQLFSVGDNLNVQMLNGSSEDYQYYENLAQTDPSYNNAYNDRSIVCDIEFKGRHLLFTGDLEYRGCDYISNKLSSSSYDLLKACHHGYIANAPDFCSRVNADYVIVPASIGMVNKNYTNWLNNVTYWVRKSKNVAIQGYQNNEIILNVDILGVHTDNTYFVNDLSCDGILSYYVDADSSDNIRTGSKEHPFKTLNEAMIFCPKNLSEEISIFVKSLPTSNNACKIIGFNNVSVTFDENIQFNNKISIINCKKFLIRNLDQTSENLTIEQSTGIIRDYKNNTGNNCINIFHSKVTLEGTLNLYINNDNAITVRNNSELTMNNSQDGITLTYSENTTKRLFSSYFCNIYFNNNLINYFKTFPFSEKILVSSALRETNLSNNSISLLELYKNDSGTFSGDTLKESITNYNYILVEYSDNDGYRHIEKFNRYGNIVLTTTRTGSSECYIKTATLTFNNSNFTITNNKQTIIRTGDNNNAIQSGNYIKVIGIYGQPPLY